jgi:RNA polymerase sigma-70 factor (ECF subfamily)
VFPSIDEIIRREGGPVVATLCRMTGDLDLAEDAYAEAVVEALRRWPEDGLPERPGAWLTTVARRKALDTLRRERTRTRREEEAISMLDDPAPLTYHTVRDDQLRLIFTCCHPALAVESRVALALRVICHLTTAEIAHAFLVGESAMTRRLTRAKAKLAANNISYRVPPDEDLPARLNGVLAVIAIVFTTGHHAPAGAELVRVDLAREAIRLAGLLADLMPDEPECLGLLALLRSTDARRSTRVGLDGLPVLLADADRSTWDRDEIAAAVELTERALRRGRPGPYQLQAAISCLHSSAPSAAQTDWEQIVTLYDVLATMTPSTPVLVNRAVAVAEVEGAAAGLTALDAVGGADDWHLYHAARAELLRRLERRADAAEALRTAISLTHNDVDGRLLHSRLAELSAHR